jgi:hypothetical protein
MCRLPTLVVDVRCGVNRVALTLRRSLPVYPEKQTFSLSVGMSQRCQRTNPLPREGAAARSGALHLPQ